MPELDNEGHEKFCCIYVECHKDLETAYLDAGYEGSRDHAMRLLKRPEVAARIAELEIDYNEYQEFRARSAAERAAELYRLQAELAGASRRAVVSRLLDVSRAADLTEAAGIREARITLLEAFRLAKRLHEDGDSSEFIINYAINEPTWIPPGTRRLGAIRHQDPPDPGPEGY